MKKKWGKKMNLNIRNITNHPSSPDPPHRIHLLPPRRIFTATKYKYYKHKTRYNTAKIKIISYSTIKGTIKHRIIFIKDLFCEINFFMPVAVRI